MTEADEVGKFEQQADDLALEVEPETVKDLDVEDADAGQVLGGGSHSTRIGEPG